VGRIPYVKPLHRSHMSNSSTFFGFRASSLIKPSIFKSTFTESFQVFLPVLLSVVPHPLKPYTPISSHSHLYALYVSYTILVIHGSLPLTRPLFPNSPSTLRKLLHPSTTHHLDIHIHLDIVFSAPSNLLMLLTHVSLRQQKPGDSHWWFTSFLCRGDG